MIPLPPGPFTTLIADPPWAYNDSLGKKVRGAVNHYPTMRTSDICALPITQSAAADAHLYLWTTNAFISEALQVAYAWGFDPKTILTWVKPQIGMGHYFRNNTEHVIFAVRGKLLLRVKNQPTAFHAPRGQHSRKPEAFMEIVERCSPGPYLELFARTPRAGWASWGLELPSEGVSA